MVNLHTLPTVEGSQNIYPIPIQSTSISQELGAWAYHITTNEVKQIHVQHYPRSESVQYVQAELKTPIVGRDIWRRTSTNT